MEREAILQLMRNLMREASLFVVALIVFLASAAFWEVTAPFLFLVLLALAIRAWRNFRTSFQQYYAGISKWPPLSREDCRVARSKLKRKTDTGYPRYF